MSKIDDKCSQVRCTTDLNAVKNELERLCGMTRPSHTNRSRKKSHPPSADKVLDSSTPNGYHQRKAQCRCGEEVNVFAVRKPGENQGRLFAECKNCGRFFFMDCPLCRKCSERMYRARCKKPGANCGRMFIACPLRCEGSFRWLEDHEHLGGGWEID